MMADPADRSIQSALQAPTPPSRIEYLPVAIREDGDKFTAIAAPYVDARFTQDRLDEVLGAFNWQSATEVVGGLLMVGIGIREPGKADWVWRWDTGQDEPISEDADDEGITGGRGIFSRGFKRCGYQFGIARDVYAMRRYRVPCEVRKITRNSREAFLFRRWLERPGDRQSSSAPSPARVPAPAAAPPPAAPPAPVPAQVTAPLPDTVTTTTYYEEARTLGVEPPEAATFAEAYFNKDTRKTDWRSALEALRREKA